MLRHVSVASLLISVSAVVAACGQSGTDSRPAQSLHPDTFAQVLSPDEASLGVGLLNRLEVDTLRDDGLCIAKSFQIISQTIGFNPAVWSAESAKDKILLTDDEVPVALSLVNRVRPGLVVTGGGLETKTGVLVKYEVCGFNPARWTAQPTQF